MGELTLLEKQESMTDYLRHRRDELIHELEHVEAELKKSLEKERVFAGKVSTNLGEVLKQL